MSTDPFVDLAEEDDMSRATTTAGGEPVGPGPASPRDTREPRDGREPRASADVREPREQTLRARRICPFCGAHVASGGGEDPCPRCTMEDTPATRSATKARIGPWYVLQARNPAAPGMKYQTLLSLVGKGQVTARSIVRGPTTHQLWRFAGHVRGLSREFGLCFSCGAGLDKSAAICPHCERSQSVVGDPDQLVESHGEDRRRPANGAAAAAAAAAAANDAYEPSHAGPSGEPAFQAARVRAADRLRPPSERGTAPVPVTATGKNPMISTSRLSAMDLAAALQAEAAAQPLSKRWLVTRVAAIVIGLAALIGAALLYQRPDYRAATVAWLSDTWDAAQAKTSAAFGQLTGGGGNATTSPAATQRNEKVVERPKAEPPKPRPTETVQQKPAPTPAAPVKRPEVEVRPPPANASNNANKQPVAVRETTPAAKSPDRPVEASVLPPVPSDPQAQLQQARQLRSQALDAESRGDYPQAIRLYEQIKRLPRETWPSDLEISLTLAKRRVEAQR